MNLAAMHPNLPADARPLAADLLAQFAADDARQPATVSFHHAGSHRVGSRVQAFHAMLASLPGPNEKAGGLEGLEKLQRMAGLHDEADATRAGRPARHTTELDRLKRLAGI